MLGAMSLEEEDQNVKTREEGEKKKKEREDEKIKNFIKDVLAKQQAEFNQNFTLKEDPSIKNLTVTENFHEITLAFLTKEILPLKGEAIAKALKIRIKHIPYGSG